MAAQEGCVVQQPLAYGVIHEQAVSINTNVLLNTTFSPMPDVAVTFNNAPTSINGITTFTWTETKTYTSNRRPSSFSTNAFQPTPTTPDSSFVMLVRSTDLNQKRQSGSYFVSAAGTISNDCTNSLIYTISASGELTATVSGIVHTYSTSPNTASAPFVPSTVAGSITTTFSTGANQVLTWRNPAFFKGQAAFCAMDNGTVYAVFAEGGQPEA